MCAVDLKVVVARRMILVLGENRKRCVVMRKEVKIRCEVVKKRKGIVLTMPKLQSISVVCLVLLKSQIKKFSIEGIRMLLSQSYELL